VAMLRAEPSGASSRIRPLSRSLTIGTSLKNATDHGAASPVVASRGVAGSGASVVVGAGGSPVGVLVGAGRSSAHAVMPRTRALVTASAVNVDRALLEP